ncbi:MAG TPA: CBS domain-containing protein [Casimicrobiaceae bacterium]
MAKGIGEFCVRNVVTVAREATVSEAAALMRQYHIGAVLVADERADGKIPAGILTDRDIVVEIVAAGLDATSVKVGELMQRPVTTITESADYGETVRLMAVNGVRRMPVVDARGRLVGIITVDDILRQLAGPLVALADLAVRERHYETETRR